MRRGLSEFRESVAMALSALAAHKLRSALTLLGVMIGVFSIILVMTAVRAMKNNIENQIGQLGSRTVIIQRIPVAYFGGPEGFRKFLRRQELTYVQGARFRRRANVEGVVGLHAGFWNAELTSPSGIIAAGVGIEGATPEVFPAFNWSLVEGRPMLEADVGSARDICLLSNDVAKTLFPAGSCIGKRVRLGAINYTVMGVFERTLAQGSSGVAVIPVTTGLNRFGRRREVSIVVQAHTAAALPGVIDQTRGMLRTIRKVAPGAEDDFEIITSDAMIAQFEQVTFAVRVGLAVVSSIALLAAGVGIMNIMLVSVTERTREIGVRRAIGAKKRSIMSQFMVEAVVLCQIGGLVGIGLGLLAARALAVYLLKVPPAYPMDWALIGIGICSVVGVVFGTYPAYKAAHLDPIESLRYE